MIQQPDLFAPQPNPAREKAELRRDLGIARADARASRTDPAWRLAALEALRLHASSHDHFLVEDVAAAAGTPVGVDGRAWGAIAQAARRRGWIQADGYAPANSSNRSPKVLWRSAIGGGA